MDTSQNKKLIRAKERIEDIKKFYKHIVTYVLINLFLAFVWDFTFKIFGDFVISNQFDGDNFTSLPIWLIWGIFLAAHAIKTFGFPNAFGKDWEERKIKEFMKE
ncbi:2TM domain-containing protein [Polaribacter sp. IC063]|uniref:2TM domain-containing protein n=1 Tax=Polaribacter sp. IC063 TaxID=57031 RepID=UPI0011BDC748|nr:2TM domain-containing protein [Polaribacter sp. IC063]TXD52874.1 2TM domain-containing protein [Polaribacter sp. IC063]